MHSPRRFERYIAESACLIRSSAPIASGRAAGDADADPELGGAAAECEVAAERHRDPVGHLHGDLAARHSRRTIRNSSPPSRPIDIAVAARHPQALCDENQQLIARGVAERVVDRLELVEVDVDDSRLGGVLPRQLLLRGCSGSMRGCGPGCRLSKVARCSSSSRARALSVMSSMQVIAPLTSPVLRCRARTLIRPRRQTPEGSSTSTSRSRSCPLPRTSSRTVSKPVRLSGVSVFRSVAAAVVRPAAVDSSDGLRGPGHPDRLGSP